jgi:thiol-disulfide isomerase/thioredoxin
MTTEDATMNRIARSVSLAALAGLLLTALPTLAQVPSDAVLRDFVPTGDYLLKVGGKEVPKARIYFSERAAAYLVVTSAFDSPVLLSPRGGSVETVNLMKVVKRDDGTIDLLADATLQALGRFQVDGQEIAFRVGGQEARLAPNPPLVGTHPIADLLAHSPEYGHGAALYHPDDGVLAQLRQRAQPVEVRVFFGSWCPHCKRYLPNVLKVQEELEGSKIAFEYYGVASPPEGWQDPELLRLGVHGVPTAIVYVGGKELGRITSTTGFAQFETVLESIIANGIPMASGG